LNSLVYTVIILNVVPMYFVMSYAPSTKGSWLDSDFWTLVSNSSITLLGILTAMYPYRNIWRGASSARRWGLVFAIIGVLCVPAAILIYRFLSIKWSMAVCISGLEIQAVMGLQLVEDAANSSITL
jgi:hypothetical protein